MDGGKKPGSAQGLGMKYRAKEMLELKELHEFNRNQG